MKLSQIIIRIRGKCPLFQSRVGGSSEFTEKTLPEADVSVPYAWVVPMGDTVGATSGGDDSIMRITESFAVIICIDNSVQRSRGDAVSVDDIQDTIRTQLINALCTWSPSPHMTNMRYRASRHLSMNNKRLWHQFTFDVAYSAVPDPAAVGEGCTDEIVDSIYSQGTPTGITAPHATVIDGIEHTQWQEDPSEELWQQERDIRELDEVDQEGSTPIPSIDPIDGYSPSEYHHGAEGKE